jgi:CBS domain-containing protein
MLLKELCTLDVVCCAPETRILTAARLMRERHVGDLVVVADPEGDQTPIGIVTDRDIVVEVLGRDRDPATVTVREIMRTPAVIASETEESATAIERMRHHGVRRMPIMGVDRNLAGIVCLDDLLKQVAADVNALVDIVAREQGYEHRTRR